jgi:hypothetical protein
MQLANANKIHHVFGFDAQPNGSHGLRACGAPPVTFTLDLTMKLLRYIVATLSAISSIALAQSPTAYPEVASCAPMGQCVEGLGKLDEEETKIVKTLLSAVPAGASESHISQKLGRLPFDTQPPLPAWASPKGKVVHKALWSTVTPPERGFGPHLDVLFWNGGAVGFSWYAAKMKKVVRVQLVPM